MLRLTCPLCLEEKVPLTSCGPEHIHIFAGEEIVRCPTHPHMHVAASTDRRAWAKWNLLVGHVNRTRGVIHHPGHDMLSEWFSLSYASFLTMPRSLMHAMPDDWQARMSVLLAEYQEAFPCSDLSHLTPSVIPMDSRRKNAFTKWPSELLNYRHPNSNYIDSLRS